MKFKRIGLTVSATAVLMSSLIPAIAHAQTVSTPGFAAAISPLPILLNAKPGTSVGADLRVSNPSTHDEQLKVVLKTFTQDGANGTVTLHDVSAADDFVNWVSFSRTTFDAPPGLWQTIHMTINVPKTAAFGYYFAVEFAQANPPKATNATGTSLQGAVASFVLLNAEAPGESKQLQVTSFTANHQMYEFLPVNFSIRLHNSGNIFASASGNIFITRGSQKVATLTVNASHGLVIPGSNRVFSATWNSGFPVYKTVYGSNGQPVLDKNGLPKQKLSWNFSQVSKLRFGHYTAQLALVYNNGQRDIPISGTLSFWVVPWRVILFVILIVVGPALLVYVVMRRRFRKRLDKERQKITHASASK